ncbi:transcriptional regulator, HxlR family [Paenibacillus tianmuensis]|uniref:Transcriptional regulator, HxlR family n=1 Tax=Paenibacillus tianmuensis TaxID=624147 RepID=A0A1G4PLC8_9BACL|nr:helix-turn-helix domain-containing protein [Paenibacillus tianmuensis]SCW33076.1 transcriptional regulator, HxlR family [Paenibacillus tianmuensis]
MNKQKHVPEEVNVSPFSYAISLIDGKWKMHILFWLWKKEVLRYSELKRALGNVTHKMLSSQLRELETDDMLIRTEYPQVPPKVEYRLSPKALTLMPVLEMLCAWGQEHYTETVESETPPS